MSKKQSNSSLTGQFRGTSKSLADLIGEQQGSFGKLAAEAAKREQLTGHIRAQLEPELAAAISHCSIGEHGELIVLATLPEWAARLRFESPALLTAAREVAPACTSVKVKVVTRP